MLGAEEEIFPEIFKKDNAGPQIGADTTSVSREKTRIEGSATEDSIEGNKVKLKRRRILIIQGDWEGGMSLLSQDLQDEGHEVGKLVFCVPDLIYKAKGIRTHVFRSKIEEFSRWLRDLVRVEAYDTIFLYNHYRPYNQIAWNMSEEMGVETWVFELGLIRPNCVMVFQQGKLPIEAVAAAWAALREKGELPQEEEMPPALCRVSSIVKLMNFCTNFLVSRVTFPLFPNFVDQRDMKLSRHAKHGLIHMWRTIERSGEDRFDNEFSTVLSRKYYAVPLQVHSDTQILKCSKFNSIEEFIATVVDSFANNAPEDTKLVFKVHPMDRGYKDYVDLIAGLNEQLGGDRLYYLDRIHLPTLLEHSLGVVNVNSSVGISGLVHCRPVITLGEAVYNLPGLTFQGDLNQFWTEAEGPTSASSRAFVNLLLEMNQGRGTLSQRCFDVPGRSRIKWPKPFEEAFFDRSKAQKKAATAD